MTNKIAVSAIICLMLVAGAPFLVMEGSAEYGDAALIDNIASLQDLLSSEPWAKISIVLPSNAIAGEPVDALLKAFDATGRITAVPLIKPIFSSTDAIASFSMGSSLENHVTFKTPGIHYVVVEDSITGMRSVSNPVLVSESEPEYKWYWGELHCHTAYSDGWFGTFGVTPDTAYLYFRDVEGFDFAAVTDHDVCWEGPVPTPVGVVGDWFTTDFMKTAGWPLEKEAVNSFYAPGEFVTLLAQEWTHDYEAYGQYGDGHYNVYYNCVDEANFYSCLDEPTNRIYKMFSTLHAWKNETGKDLVMMPHHLLETTLGWDYHYYDEELVPLVEICQERGSSEMRNGQGNPVPYGGASSGGAGEIQEPGHSVQDALAMGYKMGFMAGSDDHSIGTPVMDAALTGIYAKNLTREDIFNSFKDRKCIAVKGYDTRMIVDFTVNGEMVGDGSVVSVKDANSPREIKCSVAGTAPLVSVTVVKNNRDFYTFQGTSLDDSDLSSYKAEFSITDTEPITGMIWTPGEYSNHEGNTGGKDVYYIRILQKDYNASGGAGWIGPIWVEAQSEENAAGSGAFGMPGFETLALVAGVAIACMLSGRRKA